jgi:hypothetical protein
MNSFKRRAKRVWDKENIPIRNIKRPIYDRRHPEHDYLKYWRVIRYWTLRKYNLKSQDSCSYTARVILIMKDLRSTTTYSVGT